METSAPDLKRAPALAPRATPDSEPTVSLVAVMPEILKFVPVRLSCHATVAPPAPSGIIVHWLPVVLICTPVLVGDHCLSPAEVTR